MIGKKKCIIFLFLLLSVLLGSCKKEPEIVVCGSRYLSFYGNQAIDAIDQLSQLRNQIKAEEAGEEALRWLKVLGEVPAPIEGLFATSQRDYGNGPFQVEMSAEYQYDQHFKIFYTYPRATLRITDPVTGEQTDYNCSIRYSFYRIYINRNRILQSVDEYHRYYDSELTNNDYREMIDGKLYVRDYNSDRLYFDLNPGIGVVEILNDRNDPAIPYETLLPLCQWELIPVDKADRENVTEHVGWW